MVAVPGNAIMDCPELLELLQTNLSRVRHTVADACQRCGRDPNAVCLVAVTKYVGPPVIRALLAAGVAELGESRAQQLAARAEQLGARLERDNHLGMLVETPHSTLPQDGERVLPHWHMIGHLQRNKVKTVLRYARVIHAVDSFRLAAELDQEAARLGVHVDALLEVNVSGETAKFGLSPDDLPATVAALRQLPRVRLRGLMTMAPLDSDPEHARPCFARLRETLERLRAAGEVGPECSHLSMGMSQDYAVAVEEGATLIRVGSALYENLPAAAADLA
jgi:PLP dependent protein